MFFRRTDREQPNTLYIVGKNKISINEENGLVIVLLHNGSHDFAFCEKDFFFSFAMQFKLNLFLAEEMRKWEKTFPDELWQQFGLLTNWKGAAHQRPKYWAKLINEMVYG